MEFERRLAELRKGKGFSQEELANMADVHTNVLGRYERGEAKPSIEVAAKLSGALGVSLDYLVGATDTLLDLQIVEKVRTIQKLPESDRQHVMFALDAMLRDAKARAAYS